MDRILPSRSLRVPELMPDYPGVPERKRELISISESHQRVPESKRVRDQFKANGTRVLRGRPTALGFLMISAAGRNSGRPDTLAAQSVLPGQRRHGSVLT